MQLCHFDAGGGEKMESDDVRINATIRSIQRMLSNGKIDYQTLSEKVKIDIGVGRTIFIQALNHAIGAGLVRKFREKVNGRRRFYEWIEKSEK